MLSSTSFFGIEGKCFFAFGINDAIDKMRSLQLLGVPVNGKNERTLLTLVLSSANRVARGSYSIQKNSFEIKT